MKKERLYEILGDVDERAVEAAQVAPAKRTGRRLAWIASAAAVCAALVFGIGFWHENRSAVPNESEDLSSIAIGEIAIEETYVDIYYIEDNEIISVSEYLPCTPSDIFNSWRSHNNIGDEVELIGVHIDDNGTEYVEPGDDSFVAGYIVGDTFTLTVTVTENLKNYYNTIPEEKLLESLKLTLTGYLDTQFDEYYLIFK